MMYPEQTFTLKYESSRVTIHELGDGRAVVRDLFTQDRRKGHATQLMENVIAYAERKQLILELEARRYGHPIGPETKILVDFYKRFGFEIHSTTTPTHIYMIRLLKGE